MNKQRLEFYNEGLKQLPGDFLRTYINVEGKNGDTLQYDEAEVWKRVLNYRIVKHYKPHNIVETHGGNGISSKLYNIASANSKIISMHNYQTEICKLDNDSIVYADIDPFGMPYETINMIMPKLKKNAILCLSNGEFMAVTRNLRGVMLKTKYHGKEAYKWAEMQYIPYIEELTGFKTQFYYIFPSTIRLILSNLQLDKKLFDGCKKYMWWVDKYANTKKEN